MEKKTDFSGLTGEQREFLLKTGKMLVSQISLQLIRDQMLDPHGKTDEQLKSEVASFIRAGFANKTIEFKFGIDHTKGLLAEARQFLRQEQLELSALFFATFFEHRLNWLITQVCRQKQVDDLMIAQLLREANVRSKCTWILALLGQKPIRPDVLNAINAINEIRNSFIHYKWPNAELDHEKSAKSDAQILERLKKAETVVRYLRRFEEGKLYRGHGPRVRRAIKTVSPPASNSIKS